MYRILVTGGPVHAYLDAVKIITNRFKGGLMSQLAEDLARRGGVEVTYLYAPSVGAVAPEAHKRITLVKHTGIEDYHKKVLELAPHMHAVILGAAVANLIPKKPYVGKFPSHNYKPGDTIPIEFTIAPRIIDDVKRVAPHTHLFGYKLLSGVPHEELVSAAYGIVLEARATAVFANDAKHLNQKYAVTKERGVHPLTQSELAPWILEMLHDEYYSTAFVGGLPAPDEVVTRVKALIAKYADRFVTTESGLIFGTVAVRHGTQFVTTGRGKRELDSIARVVRVDHENRVVYTTDHAKASLNAPLLARMFEGNGEVDTIVHMHEQVAGLPTYPYAPPGTVRDSMRDSMTSFNIEGHGCMLLFNQDGRQL